MTDLAVTTDGLTKEFSPGVGAVDISLEVAAGKVYGFIGPNGAGKSTTIRMLTGVLFPDRGAQRVLGLDPLADEVELQRRVGVLPSDAQYPRHHTGHSLLALLGRLRGDRNGYEANATALAERLQLDLSKKAHELSLGNRQKLGLIFALSHQPDLVILDEPTNGLDPLMQLEMDAILREIVAEGRTVLLSSHSLPEVERVADTVGFIRQARLVEQTTLSDLAARAVRRITLTFDSPRVAADLDGVDGIDGIRVDTTGLQVAIDYHGSVAALLTRAGELGAATVDAAGVDLEATFLALYHGEEVT